MIRSSRQSGIALVMVLICIAVAVILGLSYLAVASIQMAGGRGYADMVQAKYLAESGIEHAICLLQERPENFSGIVSETLGPYSIDESDGQYVFTIQPDSIPGRYWIASKGTSGQSQQNCSALVRCSVTQFPIQVNHAMISGALNDATIPAGMLIQGPVHTNANLTNYGQIVGDVTAVGNIVNFGTITPTPTAYGDTALVPPVVHTDYYSYLYNKQIGQAQVLAIKDLRPDNQVCSGGSITAENPAGVVVAKNPDITNPVTLKSDFTFTGTLIIEGDVVMDGDNVALTAMPGFPALIVTGRLCIKKDRTMTINGVVYSAGGIGSDHSNSKCITQINGSLICEEWGVDITLEGTHTIIHDPTLTKLVGPQGRSKYDPVQVLRWVE